MRAGACAIESIRATGIFSGGRPVDRRPVVGLRQAVIDWLEGTSLCT